MLPLRLTASNWIKFLLLLTLVLLITIMIQGDQAAKDRTYQKQLETEKKEMLELNTKQDDRIKELEQDVKKLKTSKVNSPKKPQQQVAVTYPIGCEQYRSEVAKYNWPVNTVLRIMKAESRCNPNAVSPTNDHGLMQLHGIPIYDPAKNIAYAYNEKYMKGGFSHWTVCTNGIVNCW